MYEFLQILKFVWDNFLNFSSLLYQRCFGVAFVVSGLVAIKFIMHWFSNLLNAYSSVGHMKNTKKGDQ